MAVSCPPLPKSIYIFYGCFLSSPTKKYVDVCRGSGSTQSSLRDGKEGKSSSTEGREKLGGGRRNSGVPVGPALSVGAGGERGRGRGRGVGGNLKSGSVVSHVSSIRGGSVHSVGSLPNSPARSEAGSVSHVDVHSASGGGDRDSLTGLTAGQRVQLTRTSSARASAEGPPSTSSTVGGGIVPRDGGGYAAAFRRRLTTHHVNSAPSLPPPTNTAIDTGSIPPAPQTARANRRVHPPLQESISSEDASAEIVDSNPQNNTTTTTTIDPAQTNPTSSTFFLTATTPHPSSAAPPQPQPQPQPQPTTTTTTSTPPQPPKKEAQPPPTKKVVSPPQNTKPAPSSSTTSPHQADPSSTSLPQKSPPTNNPNTTTTTKRTKTSPVSPCPSSEASSADHRKDQQEILGVDDDDAISPSASPTQSPSVSVPPRKQSPTSKISLHPGSKSSNVTQKPDSSTTTSKPSNSQRPPLPPRKPNRNHSPDSHLASSDPPLPRRNDSTNVASAPAASGASPSPQWGVDLDDNETASTPRNGAIHRDHSRHREDTDSRPRARSRLDTALTGAYFDDQDHEPDTQQPNPRNSTSSPLSDSITHTPPLPSSHDQTATPPALAAAGVTTTTTQTTQATKKQAPKPPKSPHPKGLDFEPLPDSHFESKTLPTPVPQPRRNPSFLERIATCCCGTAGPTTGPSTTSNV